MTVEYNSDCDDNDDSAKKSDDNSNADRAKAPVEHDVADDANAVPLASHEAVVTVAASAPASDTPHIDASGCANVVAARAGKDAFAHGRKGVFAVSAPSAPQRKLDSVMRGLTLLQSAFDVPNVNDLDEHDRRRLRAAFIEATEVYAHDALILRAYDRASDDYDWPALLSHERENDAENDAIVSSATTQVGSAESVSAATQVFTITWVRRERRR